MTKGIFYHSQDLIIALDAWAGFDFLISHAAQFSCLETNRSDLLKTCRLLFYIENLIRHYPNIRSSADVQKVVHQMMA